MAKKTKAANHILLSIYKKALGALVYSFPIGLIIASAGWGLSPDLSKTASNALKWGGLAVSAGNFLIVCLLSAYLRIRSKKTAATSKDAVTGLQSARSQSRKTPEQYRFKNKIFTPRISPVNLNMSWMRT